MGKKDTGKEKLKQYAEAKVMKDQLRRKVEEPWDEEFGKVRKFYPVFLELGKSLHFILRWFLKRHDTLASDYNINPELWNEQILIFRESYKTSFRVWSTQYLYNQYKVDEYLAGRGPSPGYTNREECYQKHYDSLAQKFIRFMIDFVCTMQLEDTVYRELFSFMMFETQFRMNSVYNPGEENKHVMYCNYQRNDPQYYQLMKSFGKEKLAHERHHQKIQNIQQKYYAERRLKDTLQRNQKKDEEAKKVLEDIERRGKEWESRKEE